MNIIENKAWVFIFSKISSETFLTLSSTDLYMITDVHMNSCKVPDILVSLKKFQVLNFKKIRQVKPEFFHADRQTCHSY
jgi:hypothetical protein